MNRSTDWLEEFAAELEALPEEKLDLTLGGDLELCPGCRELSAYAWRLTDAYTQFADGIIDGGFRPATGTIALIGTASGYEWQCGHCRRSWAEADSPLTAPCYTHRED
jgi:hypothetical protein